MTRLAAIAALLFLSACSQHSGGFCAVAEPIRPTEADVVNASDALVEHVLVHNTTGERLCGWAP